MAEKRMISKSISISEKVNSLPEYFDMLLFTWMIPHTDDFGRLMGESTKVKALVIPLLPKTVREVTETLQRLHDAGLIVWYSVNSGKFIQIVNFEGHQTGLHKRTKSRFPEVPGSSRNVPEIPGQENRTEENRSEEKGTEESGLSVDSQSKIREWLMTYRVSCKGTFQLEQVMSFIGTMDIDVIEHCIKLSEGKSVPYLETVIQRHLNEGKTTKESIRVVRTGPGEREAEIQQRMADERKNNVVEMIHQPDPVLGKVVGND